MERCPTCDQILPIDREALGARCARCRQPLYEPAGRMARPTRGEEVSCAVHGGMESVGPCSRCLSPMCETCRTPWRGQLCCAACVNQALSSGEAAPEQERAQSAQARAALLLSGSAWGVAVFVLLLGRIVASRAGPVIASLVLGTILAAVLLACVGAGQGLAALRTRGPRAPAAVAGMVLGGLYAGAVLGLGLFYLWQS